MVENWNMAGTHIHMDSNCMDNHMKNYYMDSKVETGRFRGNYQIVPLKMDPLFQIRILRVQSYHQIGRAYDQTVASISPFLTYPIRDGRSEEGRMPICRTNNTLLSGLTYVFNFIMIDRHPPYVRQS